MYVGKPDLAKAKLVFESIKLFVRHILRIYIHSTYVHTHLLCTYTAPAKPTSAANFRLGVQTSSPGFKQKALIMEFWCFSYFSQGWKKLLEPSCGACVYTYTCSRRFSNLVSPTGTHQNAPSGPGTLRRLTPVIKIQTLLVRVLARERIHMEQGMREYIWNRVRWKGWLLRLAYIREKGQDMHVCVRQRMWKVSIC